MSLTTPMYSQYNIMGLQDIRSMTVRTLNGCKTRLNYGCGFL